MAQNVCGKPKESILLICINLGDLIYVALPLLLRLSWVSWLKPHMAELLQC